MTDFMQGDGKELGAGRIAGEGEIPCGGGASSQSRLLFAIGSNDTRFPAAFPEKRSNGCRCIPSKARAKEIPSFLFSPES
jgi:hypothetical protein